MLAVSGATLAAGAPVVLAACGTTDEDEEVTPEREAELLNAVLAQQLAVLETAPAVRNQGRGDPVDELDKSVLDLERARKRSAEALEVQIEELGGEPATEAAARVTNVERAVEGLARQLEEAIAASLDAIGELSPEQRQPVHVAIVEDSAVLAELRLVLGEDPAPDAFVMGPPAEEAA